jgi:hypothetical protein
VTSEQDFNPRPSTVNVHPSVLTHEMMTIDPGKKTTHILNWKTTTFLSHIQSRSHDDRFPIPLWETKSPREFRSLVGERMNSGPWLVTELRPIE